MTSRPEAHKAEFRETPRGMHCSALRDPGRIIHTACHTDHTTIFSPSHTRLSTSHMWTVDTDQASDLCRLVLLYPAASA